MDCGWVNLTAESVAGGASSCNMQKINMRHFQTDLITNTIILSCYLNYSRIYLMIWACVPRCSSSIQEARLVGWLVGHEARPRGLAQVGVETRAPRLEIRNGRLMGRNKLRHEDKSVQTKQIMTTSRQKVTAPIWQQGGWSLFEVCFEKRPA